jgi:superoxide reductase
MVCGIVAVAYEGGAGEPVCCGQPMRLQRPHDPTDRGHEHHAPIVKATDDERTRVRVGSEPHPMTRGHHLLWIEITAGRQNHRQMLTADDVPQAEFNVPAASVTGAGAYCSTHGLWTT